MTKKVKPAKKHTYQDLDPKILITLKQVRKTMDKEALEELKESLEYDGQINAINVGKLTKEQFEKHLHFTNGIWKAEAKLEDFQSHTDGYFYVVIAGHRRLTAVRLLDWDEIEAKIYFISDSRDILRIQLAENTHHAVKAEERAIAIIESYRYDIMHGNAKDKKDFINQNKNKYCPRIINDAIAFAELPIEIQNFIFSNNIPYEVGVKLSHLVPLIRKYEIDYLDDKENIDEAKLSTLMAYHLAGLVNKLLDKSGKKGKKILADHQIQLENHFRPADELQMEMMDWMANQANTHYESHLNELKRAFNSSLVINNANAAKDFKTLLKLASNLTGEDLSEDETFVNKLMNDYVKNAEYRGKHGLDKRKK